VIGLPATIRVFVATGASDLRRGFDGLAQLARGQLEQDPMTGHLFVFANRKRDRIKILYWDQSGFAIWMKKQESDCTRPRPFTGSRGYNHNLASQPVAAGGMGSDQGSSLARR
jgi:hypothetical protein